MNRWTGTGHLTKDPKFLETENGTAICTLRIAVKRAGKQGHDGYFDVKCFDAPGLGVRAVPQGRTRDRHRRPPALRRVPDPGRQLRLARSTSSQSASSSSPAAKPHQRSGQPRAVARRARRKRRGARGQPGRLTHIAGPRRRTGRGSDDFSDRHERQLPHPPRDRHPVPLVARRHRAPSRGTSSCATAAKTDSAWARSSIGPAGSADSPPAPPSSDAAPTSTSAARPAIAASAAATR